MSIKIFIFFILFLLSSQISNTKIKSRIIFNDDSKITGEILKNVHADSITVKCDNYLVSYPKSSIKDIQSTRSIFSFGVGRGLNYGILGFNIEIEPIPQIGFMLGLGTSIIVGIAWNTGIIFYILDKDKNLIPRILLNYGTNHLIYGYGIYESFNGLNIGTGLKEMIGETQSVTLDIFYIFSNGKFNERKSELEHVGYYGNYDEIPVKISFGYQFHF